MVISALDGPLPEGTRVELTYGSGREEYVLESPGNPEVLFCQASDRQGAPIEASDTVEALRCSLWTQGPATLAVSAQGYPEVIEELRLDEGACTLATEIVLVRGDGGSEDD